MINRISSLAAGLIMAMASANPFAAKTSTANAKMAYMSRLMRGAHPTKNSQIRRLDDEQVADISGYSIKFKKCQFVKSYDDELAEDEDYDTVLATNRFIVFRLCPSDYCNSCSYGYGEYIVDMDEYLDATVGYAEEQQEEMCNQCEEECQQDDDDGEDQGDESGDQNEDRRRLNYYYSNCNQCVDICDKIENMEENGYIDATEYMECKQIQQNEDDDSAVLYAGPMCSSDGLKIKIGLFNDEKCMNLSDLDIQNKIQDDEGNAMKLSSSLLKTTFDSDTCISCLEEEEGEDENANNDNNQEPAVKEVCQQLYESAGKCELKYGFDNGYANYDDTYETQIENESVVCNFITSLKRDTYSQNGEIVVQGRSRARSSSSGTQTFFLTVLTLGTAGLSAYAFILHQALTKGRKPDLSSMGGAMA